MSDEYPASDFPYTFYFKGEEMPKWGACWGMAGVWDFIQLERDADQEVGHRDVFFIYTRIDHVGVVESADPDVFIYAIQEVIGYLLSQRDSVLGSIGNHPPEVYAGLVTAALRMRELAVQQRRAFWSSGYEQDRLRLLEVMRCCQLPPDSPEFLSPPHLTHWKSMLQCLRDLQVRKLHQLAQSGQLDKDLRKKLYEIRKS